MKILLIGGSCSLINNLIVKFKKEGHRVSLLTGERYQKKKYEKVFETYNFTYDSEKLSDIIDSVNPDVTICMGAFDSNYRWKEEHEAVKVSSHLVNILMACTQEKKGKERLYTFHLMRSIMVIMKKNYKRNLHYPEKE